MNLELLAIPLNGLCDTARGGRFQQYLPYWFPISLKIPSNLTIAAVLITLVGGWDHWSWIFFLLWFPVAAQVFAPGNPFGKALMGHAAHKQHLIDKYEGEMTDEENWEKWQVVDNAWSSLALLGLFHTLPMVALAYWVNGDYLAPVLAYVVGTPAAGYIARTVFHGDWGAMEVCRGMLGAYLTLLIV